MSKQVTFKSASIPTNEVVEFKNDSIAIIDNGSYRWLPTFTNPDGTRDVIIDINPNAEWLVPWAEALDITLDVIPNYNEVIV